MPRIILSYPFLAGEEIVSWLLSKMTGLTQYRPNTKRYIQDISDKICMPKGKFLTGHFTPKIVSSEWISENRILLIFLVRNVFDLLIDHFRFFSQRYRHNNYSNLNNLMRDEKISLLISEGIPPEFPAPGLIVWLRLMEEMLRFSSENNTFVMSYERLLNDPEAQIIQIAEYLEIELSDQLFNKLKNGLTLIISQMTKKENDPNDGFRYSLSCEFSDMLAGYHGSMIKNLMELAAPDLGGLGQKLGFPEVTAESKDLLERRLELTFVSTVFKSGTKLLEHIIKKLTGLSVNTPGMEVGTNYESIDPISFKKGQFFIWHNVLGGAVQELIRNNNAKPVFLIRNIFDLVVSQYYHFAEDVDAEIGHSTKSAEYFSQMGIDEGISLVICGATSENFHWHGFSYYFYQIQEILKFSKEYPSHVIIFDRLVNNKAHEISKLANFLGIDIEPETVDWITESSSLQAMRKSRIDAVGSGKHFRKGKPGDHVNILKRHHYDMINHLLITFSPELPTLCEELNCGDVIAPIPSS